ncbi:SPFH domain-containing protein [Microbacterium telephonicum]|uniref:SPFH domain/Band 7 family protein n=1 Tax=Microbacterium telephonicum TaxID=1714841 RepID=A0A498C2J1_9MICO|nr:SPFH domain-containing protein [Microbacterium telephonicum]RLK49443.1 SPFH domain/Band 7 family protein [Microbacterium telephonicum]
MIDSITSLFGTGNMNALIKTGGAVLTVLLVVPALFKLLVVTIDEGEAAIRTRNGKPIIRRRARPGRGEAGEVVVLRPGSHPVFPILAWYRRVDARVRSTDLPPRQLTGAAGHQHLVHASFDWRPIVTGHDLRVFELDVVNVKERVGNIVGAVLRDLVRGQRGTALPANVDLSAAVVAACAEQVRAACGIELLSVVVTGDALTDGYLLAEAIGGRSVAAEAMSALPAEWGAAVSLVRSA